MGNNKHPMDQRRLATLRKNLSEVKKLPKTPQVRRRIRSLQNRINTIKSWSDA